MAVVLLEKDPFVEAEATVFTDPRAEQFNVRRPFFGISIKDPRPAFISVYQDGGNGSLIPISLKDSSAPGGWSNANHNFILQDVQETRQEKAQIIETFGDNFVFFYGEKPIILGVQGFLLNTEDFNWKNEWFYNYNAFLRGTKCVENRARVFMGFDDVLVQGYILNCQIGVSKDMPYLCPFSFQLLLSKLPLDLSPAGSDETPTAGASTYVNQAADARTFPGGEVAEYMGSLQGLGSSNDNLRYQVNPITGDSEPVTDFAPNVPNSVDDTRTAYWVSGSDPKKRQWRMEGEALMDLNTKITAQQTEIDEVTARQRLRSNPSAFQLASRDSSVVAISKTLTTGISNSAAVIPDAPDLG